MGATRVGGLLLQNDFFSRGEAFGFKFCKCTFQVLVLVFTDAPPHGLSYLCILKMVKWVPLVWEGFCYKLISFRAGKLLALNFASALSKSNILSLQVPHHGLSDLSILKIVKWALLVWDGFCYKTVCFCKGKLLDLNFASALSKSNFWSLQVPHQLVYQL